MKRIPTLKTRLMRRIRQAPATTVWTPVDFIDLGKRDAVDKTLQRMVASGNLRRIDRGLYDHPKRNAFTNKFTVPDYQRVIDAVSRCNQVRILVDGMTAANDLGLTNAVPGQVIVHTDGRLQPIQLGNLVIQFKLTAPSKLYWAGHPAMRIVQALYWLRDNLKDSHQIDQDMLKSKLIYLLQHSSHARQIQKDLLAGLHTLPSWMQQWIRELLARSIKPTKKTTKRKSL